MVRPGLLLILFLVTPPAVSVGGIDTGGTSGVGQYRLASKPARVLTLPSSLREVSGLTLSGDGRLFAHNDERGTVYQIDRSDGGMIKQFAVGKLRLREDLEGITIVGDTFYFASSKGDLFQFTEGGTRENVPFVQFKTALNAGNDVEGICYDPETETLLMACKDEPELRSSRTGAAGRAQMTGKVRTIYSFDLKTKILHPEPRFLIDLVVLKNQYGVKKFRPSGIARHPVSGNYFLISAVGNSIIELSPDGGLLSYEHLKKKYHTQPEGIAFDANGTLYIANEGKKKGTIVVYRSAGGGGVEHGEPAEHSAEIPVHSISPSLPSSFDTTQPYLFYLHGGIVQEQGAHAVSEVFGPYLYYDILDSLRNQGFNVISEVRPKGSQTGEYASLVSRQIDSLILGGVRPEMIVVVGASFGAYIALEAAHELQNERVRFVIMGLCNDYNVTYFLKYTDDLCGNFLSIYEKSDQQLSCAKLLQDRRCVDGLRETELDMGNGHGFLYKPYEEWIRPIVDWMHFTTSAGE